MMARTRDRAGIEAQITQLEAEIRDLKRQGEYRIGQYLCISYPKGTAGKPSQSKPYGSLRSHEPVAEWGYQKSKYVPVEEVPQVKAECDRGQQIAKLQKKLGKLQEKLSG